MRRKPPEPEGKNKEGDGKLPSSSYRKNLEDGKGKTRRKSPEDPGGGWKEQGGRWKAPVFFLQKRRRRVPMHMYLAARPPTRRESHFMHRIARRHGEQLPCSGGDGKAWKSTIGELDGGTVATTDHSVNCGTDIDEKHQAEATHGDTGVGWGRLGLPTYSALVM